MTRLAIAALCAVPSLTACGPTADELRDQPPRFSVTIADYWERVATCLTDAYSGGMLVPDNLHVAGQRRAEVYLQIRGHLGQVINVALFAIRGKGSERESTVTFRRRSPMIGSGSATETEARERVERCKSVLRP
jgi:hypothetical protein